MTAAVRLRKSTGAKGPASMARRSGSLMIPASIMVVYSLLWWFAMARVRSPPPVRPASSPMGVFSEERAMAHVRFLADKNPERYIGTPGAQRVAEYIEAHGQALRAAAEATRDDLTVEAWVESASGAFECEFSFAAFTSVYFDALTVVYRITPRGAPPGAKAVLLNAHFDNSRGSPGASDCASCVAVMMEAASVLVHNASAQLAAPVVMLFNGAEETLFQGAHAFWTSGRVPVSDLGVFINLESTGPGGYDAVIQHKGAWTAEAYARAAPYPRGTVWAQDQLDLAVIPGTTDYVIFSRELPGVDIAFMMDSGAYHTSQDKTERIAPGWVQSMGENALATTAEFARVLAADAAGPTPGAVTQATDKVVFIDVFAYFMLTLSQHAMHVVRAVPLVLALSLPTIHHMLRGGGFALGAPGGGSAKHCGARELAREYGRVLRCFGLSLGSMSAALLTGGVVMGALRAELSGRPFVWFGSHLLALLTYVPASLAAGMSVYMAAPQPDFPDFLASYALLAGLLAYVGATVGIGGCILFAFTGVGACLLLLLDPQGSFHSGRTAALAQLVNFPPLALSVSSTFFGLMHVMEKITFVGHAPAPATLWVQDLGVGVVLSLAMWFDCALMLPFFVYNTRRYWKVLLLGLLALSGGVAGWTTARRSPYSEHLPKRIWAQHLTEVDAAGRVPPNSSLVLGAWDNVLPSVALPAELAAAPQLPRNGREWLSVPFIVSLFLTERYAAPPPPAPIGVASLLKLTREEAPSPAAYPSLPPGGTRRLHFSMSMVGDSMTTLNLRGPTVRGWSLVDTAPARMYTAGSWSYPVWLTGVSAPRQFDFWVDVEGGGGHQPLTVELSVSENHAGPGDEYLAGVVARLPTWTSVVSYATYQTVFAF